VSGARVKSDGISPRRRLLEEVLRERSKVVAGLPIENQDPPAESLLWPLGLMRVTTAGDHRQRALEAAVIALAWLEACERDLPAERGAVREDDPVG
jgi:hypothetical protein